MKSLKLAAVYRDGLKQQVFENAQNDLWMRKQPEIVLEKSALKNNCETQNRRKNGTESI